MLLTSASVVACPFCNSATSKEVRASLFGPDLPYNLLVTIIPFVIFALIVLLIYYGDRFTLHPKSK